MPPDFSRNVHCILGLPFDAITEAQAEALLRQSIQQRKRCFLSTPNLNFAVQCIDDAAFRRSVQQSDLSVADGWPIVMISRWIGVRLPERVAGSTLFERLQRPSASCVSVYFFGGPPGAAEAACQRVNSAGDASGMRCVGHESPGFGTIDAMSQPGQIDRINTSGADFLVVALGAQKGQAWIQHNLSKLDTPLVSHLGAVVNFAAGTVRRAPAWAQHLRLEWLWRIVEEPALWRRYARDGLRLSTLLLTRVLPLAWQLRRCTPSPHALAQARLDVKVLHGHAHVRLSGAWAHANAEPLRQQLQRIADHRQSVSFDLAEVSFVDSAVLAQLSLLQGWCMQQSLAWSISAASLAFQKTAHWACADHLLTTA